MDSKLLDDHDQGGGIMSPASGPIRTLIAQQRRGLEYLEHANRLEETADRHAQIGSALKRQFIMSDCSDRRCVIAVAICVGVNWAMPVRRTATACVSLCAQGACHRLIRPPFSVCMFRVVLLLCFSTAACCRGR